MNIIQIIAIDMLIMILLMYWLVEPLAKGLDSIIKRLDALSGDRE